MMEWWNDMRMLCARYLVASEQVERDGPVETAVRAVGYHTDEERDDASSNEISDEGYHEGPRPLGYTEVKGLPSVEAAVRCQYQYLCLFFLIKSEAASSRFFRG
jgi:hypothetical protein